MDGNVACSERDLPATTKAVPSDSQPWHFSRTLFRDDAVEFSRHGDPHFGATAALAYYFQRAAHFLCAFLHSNQPEAGFLAGTMNIKAHAIVTDGQLQ